MKRGAWYSWLRDLPLILDIPYAHLLERYQNSKLSPSVHIWARVVLMSGTDLVTKHSLLP
jgi:hypothetical protein